MNALATSAPTPPSPSRQAHSPAPREEHSYPAPGSDPSNGVEFEKISPTCQTNSPRARTADSNSINAVSFSSARTMNCFPLRAPLYLIVFTVLVLTGPGKFSVDHFLQRKKFPGPKAV
jgi:hypothetical protein